MLAVSQMCEFNDFVGRSKQAEWREIATISRHSTSRYRYPLCTFYLRTSGTYTLFVSPMGVSDSTALMLAIVLGAVTVTGSAAARVGC